MTMTIAIKVKTMIRIFEVPTLAGFSDWLHCSSDVEEVDVSDDDAAVDVVDVVVIVVLTMGSLATVVVFDKSENGYFNFFLSCKNLT
jgi:hypothetical protein